MGISGDVCRWFSIISITFWGDIKSVFNRSKLHKLQLVCLPTPLRWHPSYVTRVRQKKKGTSTWNQPKIPPCRSGPLDRWFAKVRAVSLQDTKRVGRIDESSTIEHGQAGLSPCRNAWHMGNKKILNTLLKWWINECKRRNVGGVLSTIFVDKSVGGHVRSLL